MTQFGRVEIREGHVWNGFDYSLQVWVVDGIFQDCGHPEGMKKENCCNGQRLAGRRITRVAGAEKR